MVMNAIATGTATVKEMQIAGSYVYLLVDEQGEDVWLATAPKIINNMQFIKRLNFTIWPFLISAV